MATIKQEFLDMFYLAACGAMGRSPQITHTLNTSTIYSLAKTQDVWPLVFHAMKELPDNLRPVKDREQWTIYDSEAFSAVIGNIQRSAVVHGALEAFRQADLPYCLLKGESLAQLYWEPDYRISSDVDILIDESRQSQYVVLLESMGYIIPEKSLTSHHLCCYHPQGGLVELHLQLYDDLFEDVWFDNRVCNQEPYRSFTLKDGIVVPVLGITDGFIFTVLHFIKHFLSAGAGIRQIIDILLYATEYEQDIDWSRVDALMHYLKYNKLFNLIFQIGCDICHMPIPSSRPMSLPKPLVDRVLEDIQNGGNFGKLEVERKDFFYKYTERRFQRFKKTEDYSEYIRQWGHQPILKRLFPSRKALLMKFPYVRRSPLLVPIAWIHRSADLVLRFVLRQRKIGDLFRTPNPQNDVADQRIQLIADLDMI